MAVIESKNVSFDYIRRDENGNVEGITRAVDDVSMTVEQGDFIAILGHNGSGKSTFAKHLNATLHPTEGCVYVGGKDTRKDENLWDVRQTAGMVFQNPDNQIIGQVVEEDVGFGPENLGIPTKEICIQSVLCLMSQRQCLTRRGAGRLSGLQERLMM